MPHIGKPAPRNVVVSAKERAAILAECPPHLKCLILMCADLAIRSGTARRMRPQHYNPERKTLTFTTKYGRAATLPVTRDLAKLFAMHEKADDIPYVVALNPRGAESESALRRKFKRIKDWIGIRRSLTWHDFRRTAAVSAYEVSNDVRVVQALLAHKELAHTMYYLDHNATQLTHAQLESFRMHTETVQ